MSSVFRVIGIDPGPVPGLVRLDYFASGALDRAEALQSTHRLLPELVDLMLVDQGGAGVLIQVERFVVGRRASRSSTAHAGEATRDLIGALQRVVLGTDARLYQRSASQVKPWATDARLEAAGLTSITKGMRHARDAARHALFAACHDGGVPDPLSKGARP